MKTANETHRPTDQVPAVGWNRRHCHEHPPGPDQAVKDLQRAYARYFADEERYWRRHNRRRIVAENGTLAAGVLVALALAAFVVAMS